MAKAAESAAAAAALLSAPSRRSASNRSGFSCAMSRMMMPAMAFALFSQVLPVSPAVSGKVCCSFCLACVSSCAMVRMMSMTCRSGRLTCRVLVSGSNWPKLRFCSAQVLFLWNSTRGGSVSRSRCMVLVMKSRRIVVFSVSFRNICVLAATPSGVLASRTLSPPPPSPPESAVAPLSSWNPGYHQPPNLPYLKVRLAVFRFFFFLRSTMAASL